MECLSVCQGSHGQAGRCFVKGLNGRKTEVKYEVSACEEVERANKRQALVYPSIVAVTFAVQFTGVELFAVRSSRYLSCS